MKVPLYKINGWFYWKTSIGNLAVNTIRVLSLMFSLGTTVKLIDNGHSVQWSSLVTVQKLQVSTNFSNVQSVAIKS